MIKDKNRAFYIGASDTERVIQSWNTKTFEKWWLEKQGFLSRNFSNKYTLAGTYLERRILDSLGIPMEFDTQKIIGRLRANLDGYDGNTIYECKTYRMKPSEAFNPPKKYLRQIYTQMYAFGVKKAILVAYGLIPKDYSNYFLPVDLNRISLFVVEQNDDFLEKYLPRLHYLEGCLERGSFPTEEEFAREKRKRRKKEAKKE